MRQQLGSSDQSCRESKCNSFWTPKDLVTDLNPNKFAVKLNVKDRKFGCGPVVLLVCSFFDLSWSQDTYLPMKYVAAQEEALYGPVASS